MSESNMYLGQTADEAIASLRTADGRHYLAGYLKGVQHAMGSEYAEDPRVVMAGLAEALDYENEAEAI